jgi:hypothetical protein
MRLYLLAAAVVLVMCAALVTQAAIAAGQRVRARIPVCQEDEPYLRGRGGFDGQRWARYQCVHIDRIRGR